jgi:hypothetical protein
LIVGRFTKPCSLSLSFARLAVETTLAAKQAETTVASAFERPDDSLLFIQMLPELEIQIRRGCHGTSPDFSERGIFPSSREHFVTVKPCKCRRFTTPWTRVAIKLS